VEHMQLDRCPVDQPGLLAQAPGDRLGEALLRTQDRPRQLPHPIAGMGEENMQTTAGHRAEDRGVDRNGRPRELRELTLIRHALRIARTRRVGECRSAGQRPRPVLDFGAAPTSLILFPLVTNPGSPTWSIASGHRTVPLRIPAARSRAIVFDLSPAAFE